LLNPQLESQTRSQRGFFKKKDQALACDHLAKMARMMLDFAAGAKQLLPQCRIEVL